MTVTARKRFVYDVVLQSPNGNTLQYEFSTYWSPSFCDSHEIAAAAAAQYRIEQRTEVQGISAQLREDEDEPSDA